MHNKIVRQVTHRALYNAQILGYFKAIWLKKANFKHSTALTGEQIKS